MGPDMAGDDVMTRIRRAVAAAVLAVASLVAGASAASAHAILLATTPDGGSVLKTSPARVSLRFDEAVQRPAYITVTGPSGRIDAAAATIAGPIVSVKLRPTTTTGRYTVAYRVISDDGHPVEGTFQYELAGSSAATTTPGATSPRPSTAAVAQSKAATAASQSSGSHWPAVVAGIAVVLLGAGALVWERLRRGGAVRQEPPS
jgi:methionine-rich copper-binding protein CopC